MTDTPAFAIIPLHPYEPVPDNAIMQGSMDAVMERIIDSNARNAAVDILRDARIAADQLEQTRAQETQILARGIQSLNDTITRLSRRMDAVEQHRGAQARQDAAAEAERVQKELDAMPDPDNPNAPALYPPGGELHSVAATTPATTKSVPDNEGDLPNEVLKDVPPPTGDYPVNDPSELAHPQQSKYRNPAAVSLNSDDY
jgi:hypothetical protein